jgi:hypothetical protein
VTIRAMRELDMTTLRKGWWPFIKAYWAGIAEDDATRCLAGLRAADVLLEHLPPQLREEANGFIVKLAQNPSRAALRARVGAPHRRRCCVWRRGVLVQQDPDGGTARVGGPLRLALTLPTKKTRRLAGRR